MANIGDRLYTYRIGETVNVDMYKSGTYAGFDLVELSIRGVGDTYESVNQFVCTYSYTGIMTNTWGGVIQFCYQDQLYLGGLTYICDNCFSGLGLIVDRNVDGRVCAGCLNVDLGSSLLEIGNSAFYTYGSGINNITGGYNIHTLGKRCFSGQNNIRQLNLSSALYINKGAFENCHSLESIGMREDWISVQSDILNGTFKDCYKLKNINASNRITDLSYNMYINCNSLESVTIDNNEQISNVNTLFVAVGAGTKLDDDGLFITEVFTTNPDIINFNWTRFNRHFVLGVSKKIHLKNNNEYMQLNLYNTGDVGIKVDNNYMYLRVKNEMHNLNQPPVYTKKNGVYCQVQNI